MSKKLSAEKVYELVSGAGREIAHAQLRSAVQDAPDDTVMMNQILTLQFCALHVLATCVMNRVMQQKIPLEQAADEMMEALAQEIDLVMGDDEAPELVEPKGKMQ